MDVQKFIQIFSQVQNLKIYQIGAQNHLNLF